MVKGMFYGAWNSHNENYSWGTKQEQNHSLAELTHPEKAVNKIKVKKIVISHFLTILESLSLQSLLFSGNSWSKQFSAFNIRIWIQGKLFTSHFYIINDLFLRKS